LQDTFASITTRTSRDWRFGWRTDDNHPPVPLTPRIVQPLESPTSKHLFRPMGEFIVVDAAPPEQG